MKNKELERIFSYGWILKSGEVAPYQTSSGLILSWKSTSYYQDNFKLLYPEQNFYIQFLNSTNFKREVS